jgi:hypothetical protein
MIEPPWERELRERWAAEAEAHREQERQLATLPEYVHSKMHEHADMLTTLGVRT